MTSEFLDDGLISCHYTWPRHSDSKFGPDGFGDADAALQKAEVSLESGQLILGGLRPKPEPVPITNSGPLKIVFGVYANPE